MGWKRKKKKTSLKEKLEIIGAVGPVLAELNRFGETLYKMNIEARLSLTMMSNKKGVEGAVAKRLALEEEIREKENALSSRCHFISIVVWELIDSICVERGFVHYKDREDASDGVSVPGEA